jgi:hypothetical protein
MKTVRIVKRGSDERSQNSKVAKEEVATRSREREIASTVKGWIAERNEGRRLSESKQREMLVRFAQ